MRLHKGSIVGSATLAMVCALGMVSSAGASSLPQSAAAAPAPPAPVQLCPPEPRPAGNCSNPLIGKPPSNSPITSGSFFSFPNRTKGERMTIRNRVLNTINSTWGWYTDDTVVTPASQWKRGTIRITTWSFNDSTIENALKAAHNRGAIVQVVAAASVNNEKNYKSWKDLKAAFNGTPQSSSDQSFARECSGSCRGAGGAAHHKYFLFDDTGYRHRRNVVVQTSMNLTRFAYKGQWNQATVMWNADVFGDFLDAFRLSANKTRGGYLRYSSGSNIYNMFYPGGSASRDPILGALNQVRCTSASSGGINGRTRIRMAQYAIYQNRGTAIAKKLRSLWNAGCNVRIIYSVSSRPVLSILRSRSGRGAIPMKQSVIKNRGGNIVEYNHSKWLAISGNYAGRSRGTYTVIPGSANWADLSYRSDEQMQQIFSSAWTSPYFKAFDKTWKQKTSRYPSYGRVGVGARSLNSIPEQPTFGEGIYKYLSEGG